MRIALRALVIGNSIVLTACDANQNDVSAPPPVVITAFADQTTCQIRNEVVSCAELSPYLQVQLQTDSNALILVSNASGSQSNYAADVARQLRQEGFPNAGVAGFIVEPSNPDQ